MREHSEAWFAKWEARLQEPIKNTKSYYMRSGWIKVLSIFALPWGIKELLGVRDYLNKYINFRNEYMYHGRMVTNDGTPGSGKTFSGANMSYYLALGQWEKLKSDYFTQSAMEAQWIEHGDTEKLTAFWALRDSYIFFKEREDKFIPCLVSSVPLREYRTGRRSYILRREAFLQEERMPEYVVFFNDESGHGSGSERSKTADPAEVEFWRFYRHFLDAMAVNTNQDGEQNMIQIRRSTDYVNHLFGQEWVMAPGRLLRRCERKERKYFDRLYSGKMSDEQKIYRGQELYFLKKYIATIGFRKVEHQLAAPSGGFVGERGYYIFPAIGGVEYNDRCFRNLYKCKDKKIELKGWEELVVADRDDDGESASTASA